MSVRARTAGGRRTARRRGLGGLAVLVALAGCARQSAPPGGPPDSRPPGVIATVPEAFADVPGFRGPIRFEFDERISEQVGGGGLDDAVTVSPYTGEVRVSHGRRSLSVEVGGGFRDGVVYRVTLLPVVRDMFGNTLRDPFELVFTTGAEPEATAVAGEIWDRVTGRGVADLTLHAVGADSLVHLAASGDGGIYAFRYLPGGTYTLTAFQDVNRDREVGPNEVQGSVDFTVASGDTLFVDVPVLLPDTSAAVLLGAEVLDSVTVMARFDDFLDPTASLDDVEIIVQDTLGNAVGVGVAARYHEVAYMEYAATVSDSLTRADSIARAEAPPVIDTPGAAAPPPDTLAAPDTLAVPDSVTAPAQPPGAQPRAQAVRRGPPPLPGPAIAGVDAARGRGRTLPGRRIVLVLDRPLEPGVPHEVVVRGVVNVNGVGGGGGEGRFMRALPAEPGLEPGPEPGSGPGPNPEPTPDPRDRAP
jgi:hypothetical protein